MVRDKCSSKEGNQILVRSMIHPDGQFAERWKIVAWATTSARCSTCSTGAEKFYTTAITSGMYVERRSDVRIMQGGTSGKRSTPVDMPIHGIRGIPKDVKKVFRSYRFRVKFDGVSLLPKGLDACRTDSGPQIEVPEFQEAKTGPLSSGISSQSRVSLWSIGSWRSDRTAEPREGPS